MVNDATEEEKKEGSGSDLSRYVFGSGYAPMGEEGEGQMCAAPAELAKNTKGVDPIQPGNYYITDSNGFVDEVATERERDRIEATEQASEVLANALLGGAAAAGGLGTLFGANDGQSRPAFLDEATAAMKNMLPQILSFDLDPQEILAPTVGQVQQVSVGMGLM